jgi:S1-C subfamily serine protease
MALVAFLALPLEVHAQRTKVIVAPPTGWFGVRISDQAMIDDGGNAFFDSYPIVTGVDSSSPAAKAGVKEGDVLLSFNSHDMRGGSVELAKWLKVGAPFVLRIRRNDQVRVIRGTLGRRPDGWEPNMVVELTVPEMLEKRS